MCFLPDDSLYLLWRTYYLSERNLALLVLWVLKQWLPLYDRKGLKILLSQLNFMHFLFVPHFQQLCLLSAFAYARFYFLLEYQFLSLDFLWVLFPLGIISLYFPYYHDFGRSKGLVERVNPLMICCLQIHTTRLREKLSFLCSNCILCKTLNFNSQSLEKFERLSHELSNIYHLSYKHELFSCSIWCLHGHISFLYKLFTFCAFSHQLA